MRSRQTPLDAGSGAAPTAAGAHAITVPAGERGQRSVVAVVRSAPVFTAVFLVGLVIRALATVTYRPSMEFFGDSIDYLRNAGHLVPSAFHPLGYPLLLRVLSWTGALMSVPALQHVVGLATGVLVYRLVRRAGAGDLLGALAAAPVLLDGYQIDVEQFVLSDSIFTLLVVAALVVATRRVVTVWSALFTGLLLAAAILVRTVGIAVAGVIVLAWLVRRVGWRPLVVGALAAVIPLVGYAGAYAARSGNFALQGMSGRFLYGEVAPFADCSGLSLPAVERGLCPTMPPRDRPGINYWVWSSESPYHALTGTEEERDAIAGDFAHRVIAHQPLDYLAAVAATTGHYFAPGRSVGPRDWYVGSWQFWFHGEPLFWHTKPSATTFGLGGVQPHVLSSLVGVLRGYQRWAYTPGPLLALGFLVAAVAWLRRRRDAVAGTGLVFGLAGLAVLVTPSLTVGFDYRYLLPAVALLPAAGALGWVSLRSSALSLSGVFVGRALVVATVATVIVPGVGSAAAAQPGAPRPIGTAQPVGDALTVKVDQPKIVDVRCMPNRGGDGWHPEWRIDVPVTVIGRTGARLVQPDNVTVVVNGDHRVPFIAYYPFAPLLPTRVVHHGQRVSGVIETWVAAPVGTAVYQDAFGHGAAAWSFDASPVIPVSCG